MSLVLPEITIEGAERLSQRISIRLDAIADNYVAVMPLIREAINRNAHAVLGYASPGAYVKDRFGDALAKLGAELRREVVRELSSAGLSTRAIAPVVSVSHKTVARDLESAPVSYDTPAEVVPDLAVDASTGEVYEAGDPVHGSPEATVTVTETHAVKTVTGLDGKTYTPKPRTLAPILTGDAAAKDNAEQLAIHFGRSLLHMAMLTSPTRRAYVITDWPIGCAAATWDAQELATPESFRAIAVALNQLADEWENK